MRPFLHRLIAAAALTVALVVCGAHAIAQQRDRSMQYVSEYPLIGDAGERVPNHTVKLPGPIESLPGVVIAANRTGKTPLIEFYDLNCPFCRIASVDIGDLVGTDPELKLVLVPYPVLGAASIAASRVELALAKLGTPQQFYAFHRKIYAQRGTTDGLRALTVAHEFGFDDHVLTALADSDEITQTMKKLVALGNALGLEATPSFIIGGVAILGYPGRHTLESIVDAAKACGKVIC
jgi:protein-disulfide isomerase